MRAKDFLFPKELRVTPTNLKNVLLVGSCLAESYLAHFKTYSPETEFDHVMFNNITDLPESPPRPADQYDFQIIQLPLRYVVTDVVVKMDQFSDAKRNEEIIDTAFNICRLMLDAAMLYNKQKGILTFVANFVSPQTPVVNAISQIGTQFDFSALVRRLNAYLVDLVAQYQNAFVADIDSLAGSIGKRYFLDDFVSHHNHGAYWAPWHRDYDTLEQHNAIPRIDELPPLDTLYAFHEVQMFEAVWGLFEYLYRISRQIDVVKLVVFDLDDTLWRGQIAEHYSDDGKWPVPHGWPFGIWETVQNLRARGILTAIASKNTEEVVSARWHRAVQGKWVTLEDFVFKEINWAPKAENIARMIQQASLTPKSVVFVDDNPVERESVKAAVPGIRVIGSNPYLTKRILLWSSETQILRVTAETARREEMIQRQQEREAARSSLSREAFLASLNARVEIRALSGSADPSFNRAFELLNKTNQFNTTGERHSEAAIAAFLSNGGMIYIFSVADKFTDYGLVGVILLRNDGCFQQFVMSCRVLGLDVETSAISHIVAKGREKDADRVFTARVTPTDANMVCRSVYQKSGFLANDETDVNWVLPKDVHPHIAEHLLMHAA